MKKQKEPVRQLTDELLLPQGSNAGGTNEKKS